MESALKFVVESVCKNNARVSVRVANSQEGLCTENQCRSSNRPNSVLGCEMVPGIREV